MGNASELSPADIAADGFDVSGNIMSSESWAQLPALLWANRETVFLEARMVGAALACIYLGSQAALRRPPSASPPKKKNRGSTKDDDDEEENEHVQGLQPSDAIMFPILAGTILVGLYYLIKWLEDPAILNKILGVYFSLASLLSMGKLFSDLLQFLTCLVFPEVWRTRDGKLFHFDLHNQKHYYLSAHGDRVYDTTVRSSLPGERLSKLPLSERARRGTWETRRVFQGKWRIRLTILRIAKETFHVKLNDIIGFLLAIAANMVYQSTKSTFVSNVMGCALSYAGVILMTPTTFATGSAVLFGLFFYDIYMVFYTPYMVTVATKLEVPIKLVFESPGRSSMLGLGDIVIPGMFIALALRFDHFMHYYRQRELVPVQLKTEDASTGQLVESKDTQRIVVKPSYVSPQGQWGNRLWSSPWGRLLSPDATPALKASTFPRPYFHAAMFGYMIAMVVTMIILFVFSHPQPALLYLVPGVVSSVWIVGAIRGELREMWMYTEDGSLDKKDVVVEVDADGNVVKEDTQDKEAHENDDKDGKTSAQLQDGVAEKGSSTAKEDGGKEKRPSRVVFAFTIEAPPSLAVDDEE